MTDREYLESEWTDAEIRKWYQQMDESTENKVMILSELTLKDEDEIRYIVGLPIIHKPKPQDWHVIAYEMWKRGMNDTEIAKVVNKTSHAIASWRRYHGLPGVTYRISLTTGQLTQLKELYSQGLKKIEIARELGIHPSTVTRRIISMGLQRN